MPVPDPTNGSNRWSIDFLLADQDGIPTFVECKRHDDARARREVIGQMLDYVANGHHYWTTEDIRNFAEQSASADGKSIDSLIASFGPGSVDNADAYFQNVEKNLRAGKIRMIFVLEDSSFELRSVVEFLNRQMLDADVLLVEIRQYEVMGQRIAVPTLFGFTEQARIAKRDANQSAAGAMRRKWDEASFIQDALTKITSEQLTTIKHLIRTSEELGWDIKWGTGKENGSLSVRIPGAAKRSLFSIYSNGVLVLNFGWLHDDATEEQVRDSMADFARQELKAELPTNYREKYVSVPANVWSLKTQDIINFFRSIRAGSHART
jgi:hypothetical protein